MYDSTGISLKDLLAQEGMLESDQEEDEQWITPGAHESEPEDSSPFSDDILRQLADPGWVLKEKAIAKAYSTVASYMSPRNIRISGKQKSPTQEILEAVKYCVLFPRGDQIQLIIADFLQEVSGLFHLVEMDIEQHFASVESISAEPGEIDLENIARMMSNLFDTLVLWQSGWNRPLKHVDLYLMDHRLDLEKEAGRPIPPYYLCNVFVTHFHGLLHSYTRSSKFHRYLEIYFRSTLPPLEKVHYDASASQKQASGKLRSAFMKPHKELHRLGYLPKYSSMLVDLAYARIKRLVQGESDVDRDEEMEVEEDVPSWSRPMLAILRKEVQRQVVTWLYTYINAGSDRDYQRKPNIYARIEYALQSALFEHRVKELFSIIVDFPESQPGLEDIRDCSAIHKPTKRARMIEELGEAMRKRLLHPGAETKDIISQYVSTIRAVKIIDSSGILLYAIAGPIQEYLKQRKDTISCIVSMLVDGNDLIEAGEDQPDKIKPIQVKHEQAEDWTNPNWDPEPIDAAPEFKSQKASDIISTLVGMYDSRETIVIELQQWLAKRLLNAQDYEVDAEIMEIEKLKLRFGDTALHVCDIMLKDLTDSKRINNRIQSDQSLPVKPKILSHLYWPAIKEPKFRLPKKLQKIQDQYGNAYHRFRQDKKLKFYHQGTVVIEVQLQDRQMELEVTLLQASVLEAFSKHDRFTLEALTKRLKHKDQVQVQHVVDYWVNAGVLHCDPDGSFVLLEVSADQGNEQEGNGNLVAMEQPVELESAEEIQHDLHEKHWPEIQGLLAARYDLTTDEIHAVLSRLPSYDEPRSSLERFLGHVTRNGLIECAGFDRWRLAEQLE